MAGGEEPMAPSGEEPMALGGEADFEAFFRGVAREVAAVVAVTTGDAGLAEEARQEAMTRAYERWAAVRELDRPDLWVIRVATRVAIDGWRRRRREVAGAPAPSEEDPADDPIQALSLRWGLERLSPEDRLLLILRHRDGMSIEEVSRLTRRSPHTVTAYLKRARRRLRALLSEEGP